MQYLVVIAVLVLSFTLAGCATTPQVSEKPRCIMPQRETLPQISKAQLEPLDDDTYWALQERESRIVDWAMDMQAILEVVCKTPNEQDTVKD